MTSTFRPLVIAALLFASTSSSSAGVGGSAGQIRSAVASGSVDAIVAEVERTEALMCAECVDAMTQLLDHARYEVREAAGWWFAKRPSLKKMMVEQMVSDLSTSNATSARNAADFLGAVRAVDQLGVLAAAYDRGVSTEVRFAIVRAVGLIASRDGSAVLAKGMVDADPGVRVIAAALWRDVRGQAVAGPVIPLLNDGDALVRSQAAATIGGLRDGNGRARLEILVVSDVDATVRRNAAWALGELGQRESAAALDAASKDVSPLVRGVAKAARQALR
jgi:HEAT repeats